MDAKFEVPQQGREVERGKGTAVDRLKVAAETLAATQRGRRRLFSAKRASQEGRHSFVSTEINAPPDVLVCRCEDLDQDTG